MIKGCSGYYTQFLIKAKRPQIGLDFKKLFNDARNNQKTRCL
jgi:hypothetical protein